MRIPGPFYDDQERQAVDEAAQIRTAGVAGAGGAGLPDQQEIVVKRTNLSVTRLPGYTKPR